MTDKPKGVGRWISGSGGGGGRPPSGEHHPDCSGLHSAQGYCVVESERGQGARGQRERRRINAAAATIRSVLKDHALQVATAARNGELDDDDKAELAQRLDRELKTFPAKLRGRLREAGGEITAVVAEGDRKSGWQKADETAIALAPGVPPTWSPPSGQSDPEEIQALVEQIPR